MRIRKILAKISIDLTSCWIWTGSKNQYGYPRYGYRSESGKNKWIRIHRLIYSLFFGELLPDLDVCHRCDNPSCVRPSHLFTGTAQDNVNDMITKGRMNTTWPTVNAHRMLRGSKQPQAKLMESTVRDIRQVYKQSSGRRGIQAELARMYSVSPQTINGIIKGREWQHV